MFRMLERHLRGHFPMSPPNPDYLSKQILDTYGSARIALLYASLFVPELIEVDGSVFLAEGYPEESDQLRAGIQKYCPDENTSERTKFEDIVNYVEVAYLFTDRIGTDEEIDLLAEFVADAWRGRLALKFPGRKFRVYVESADLTGSPMVRFYEER